ncbi:O-antigen ligase [Granulicella aggregans]|uniref:O-antigen ligase n=1 Tax=Granulicella aggregans TaxID=474949 RepID=A0A7W7ZGU8_9BACT|nr:O-antigen ligase family protein [Granulicella aggregans]MBB5059680.1 O-antigen ligase [Granulicella aggregans]
MSAAIVPVLSNPRLRAASAISMPGLIGCYLGVRFCLTFLFFQSDPRLGATVGVAINLLLVIPIAIYTFGATEIALRTMLRNPVVRLVFGYLALALASLLWSETASKAVAVTYWIALAADVILVLLLIRSDGIELASKGLLKGYICGVALLCMVAWCAPTMQDLRLGDDEFLTPNGIGFECAFAVLLCQYFAPQGARWKWLGTLFALTLLRSLSKTTIVAFLIAEAFYLFRTTLFSRSTKIKVIAFAVLVTLAFSGLLANYYTVYINAGNQAETLTGRTSIWIVTLGYALEAPWFGHGFHSFRNIIPAFGAFQPWHAHNEFLQQFFTFGIVGVALVLSLYIAFYRICRRYKSHPFALTGVAMLVLIAIRGLADTERFDISFPLWAIVSTSLLLTTGEAHP